MPPSAAGRPPPSRPSSPARARRGAPSSWPPSVRSRSAWKLAWSSARNGSGVPSSDRLGVPSPPVTLTVRCEPAGTETVPPSRLQEHRRQAGVGGRRDPGLQLGRRRRRLARQRRLHRLRQPRGRVRRRRWRTRRPGPRPGRPQRPRIAAGQARARQPDAQPPHLAHGARDVRLPERQPRPRRIGRPRGRPIGQHCTAAGASAPRRSPAAGRPRCRPARRCRAGRASAARRSAARRPRAAPICAQGGSRRGRSSKARQTNSPATPSGGHSAGQMRSNSMAARARARRPARRRSRRSVSPPGSSVRVRFVIPANVARSRRATSRRWAGASRMTDQLSPSTMTSAASGRAL